MSVVRFVAVVPGWGWGWWGGVGGGCGVYVRAPGGPSFFFSHLRVRVGRRHSQGEVRARSLKLRPTEGAARSRPPARVTETWSAAGRPGESVREWLQEAPAGARVRGGGASRKRRVLAEPSPTSTLHFARKHKEGARTVNPAPCPAHHTASGDPHTNTRHPRALALALSANDEEDSNHTGLH